MIEMKDSGIEWLGEIPLHWKICKLKVCLQEPLQYGANSSGVEFDENLPRYIRITDIISVETLKDTGKLSLDFDEASQYLLEDEDILFARSGATVGKTFIYSSKVGKSAFAGYLIRAKINRKKLLPKFFIFFTQSFSYDEWKNQIFIQATIQNIGAEKYNNLKFPLPPLEEQKKIADFLDKKCSAIDSALDAAKKLVEKFREYKKSLITETVTKGLNPSAEFVDSNIEWLGEIPSHWKIIKLKFLVDNLAEKNNYIGDIYIGLENIESWTGKINLENCETEVDSVLNSFDENFVLFNKLRPYLAKVARPNFSGQCSTELLTLLPQKEIYKNFLFFIMISHGFICKVDSSTYGTKMPRANWNFIVNIKVPFPPLNEQKKIADFLDAKCAAIDENISKREKLIEKLTEYKKSLIYEAVTGKLEV